MGNKHFIKRRNACKNGWEEQEKADATLQVQGSYQGDVAGIHNVIERRQKPKMFCEYRVVRKIGSN